MGVWTKTAPKGKASKSASVVNDAKRDGATEGLKHETVGNEFKKALMQARMAKKMSQTQLATAINEKSSVVNEYESGKAIPKGDIINKLSRALGVRLPKAKM